MAESGGSARPDGTVVAEKNVTPERGGGVRPLASRVRATLDADGLRVVIVASASYAGTTPTGADLTRLATATYEVPLDGVAKDLAPLLRAILKEHGDGAADLALEAAYEARAQARRAGEIV